MAVITVRTTREAHTAAIEVSRALGMSLNTFVVLAVTDAVQRTLRDHPELHEVIAAQRKLRGETVLPAIIAEGSHDG